MNLPTHPGQEPSLAARLNAGEEAAFEEALDLFGRGLLRVARALGRSREDAEDAVQDVFVALARARGRLAGIVNLKAYLFASLRRALARRAREFCRARELAEKAALARDGETGEPVPHETSPALERALRRLPEEQREVVALKIDAGLTFAEIAQVLGVRQNTAASRYRYALMRLRREMGEPSDGRGTAD